MCSFDQGSIERNDKEPKVENIDKVCVWFHGRESRK
jgi:hypothetical protein